MANDDQLPVNDDDEKKHPTIVKNGKKPDSNGTSVEDGSEESAKVNGDLNTVTWTADESKKTNGTTHNGNGAVEEKEPLKSEEEETKQED